MLIESQWPKKLLKKSKIYTIYEIIANDTRQVLVELPTKKILVEDDDDVVLKRLFLFEQEFQLKPLLYTTGEPKVKIEKEKVILFVGRSHFRPTRIEKRKVKWDFLFTHTFTFNAIMKWRRDSLAIEISLSEYLQAIESVVRGDES